MLTSVCRFLAVKWLHLDDRNVLTIISEMSFYKNTKKTWNQLIIVLFSCLLGKQTRLDSFKYVYIDIVIECMIYFLFLLNVMIILLAIANNGLRWNIERAWTIFQVALVAIFHYSSVSGNRGFCNIVFLVYGYDIVFKQLLGFS